MTAAGLTDGPARSVSLDALTGGQPIAVLAPHPDDETLGCGGLIAAAVRAGAPVVVVMLTDGSGSHPSSATPASEIAAMRSSELRAATAELGLTPADVFEMGLPDGRLAELNAATVASQIAAILQPRGTKHVFVTGPSDTHPDHRAAFQLAGAAARMLGATLWTYPIRAHIVDLCAGENQAVKVDISPVLARKQAAIRRYSSQIGEVIGDDPNGFQLTAEDLERHGRPYEIFQPARPLL